MSNSAETQSRPYQGAADSYSRYRPPYPASLVAMLRDTFALDGTGRLLDLGCGPGSVAIPIAHLFERVVAMDPEPDMLAEGKDVAARANVRNIDWVRGSSEDLSASMGTFRLVTMGESFHWMDRDRTLAALYDLIEVGGGVAVMGRGMPLPIPPMTPWRAAAVSVVRKYVGDRRTPWDLPPPTSEEFHQTFIRRSRFKDAVEHSELFDIEWNLESILGNLYSMSFCSRKLLGDRVADFERDMREALLAIEPSGIFRGERHEFYAVMAFKR